MKRKGFTLVEMLAVVAILGILVIIVLPNVLKNYRDAKKVAFIDEAKTVYTKATDKYVYERSKGNKVGYLSNEQNPLELMNAEDLEYMVRIDSDGRVTAFRLANKDFCIIGIGDFLNGYTKEDIIDMTDEEEAAKCVLATISDGEVLTVNFGNDLGTTGGYDPRTIYLLYNKGWSRNKTNAPISEVYTPAKENAYYEGAYVKNIDGLVVRMLNCDGSIAPDKTGGGIFTGREERSVVTARSKFIQKYYTLNFDGGNESTVADSTLTCNYGASNCKIPESGATKTGFTFLGWAKTQGSTSVDFVKGQELPTITDSNEYDSDTSYFRFNNEEICLGQVRESKSVDNTRNLYAVWAENSYTVVFNGNGNTGGSMDSQTFTYSEKKALTANGFTRTGYTFQGWSTSSSSTTVAYTNGQQVEKLSSVDGGVVNLYAVWGENSYTVAFKGNTNTGGSMSDQTFRYTEKKALTTNGFTKKGYTFNGWGTSASTTTVSYTNRQEVEKLAEEPNSTINLYAIWGENSYTVVFHGSGNTGGSMSNQTFRYTEKKALTTNGFIKTGYKFLGWATTSGSTAVAYEDGKEVEKLSSVSGGTVDLYAVWDSRVYTITLNKDGGSGDINYIYEKYNTGWYSDSAAGTKITSIGSIPTKDNSTFTGYFDGSTRIIRADKTIEASNTKYTENKTVTAKWCTSCGTVDHGNCTENIQNNGTCTYTTTCNENYELKSGSGTANPKCCRSCVVPSHGSCVLTWESNACKYTTTCNDGYTISNNGKYNPSCTPTEYSITYNANGGTVPNTALTKYTIETNTYTLPSATKNNSTFEGWYDNSGLTGTAVTSIPKGSTGNKTFWAKWSAQTYTVTLDKNGGTADGTTSVQVTYGGTVPSFTNPEKKYTVTYNANGTGASFGVSSQLSTYTLDGWYTAASGGSKVINTNGTLVANVSGYTNSSSKWIKTSDTTLYAHWSGGTITTTTVTKSGKVCSLNTSSSGGSGTNVAPSSSYTPTADTTLYAICASTKTITVTFNRNKAEWNSNTTRTCSVNAYGSCTVTAPNVSNYGGYNSCINGNCSQQKALSGLFTVRGWNTSSTATTASLSNGGTITVSSNTTYYAIVSLTRTSVKTFTEGADGVFVRKGAGGSYTSTGLIPAGTWITISNYKYTGDANNPLWVFVSSSPSCSNHNVSQYNSSCSNWMTAQWITW